MYTKRINVLAKLTMLLLLIGICFKGPVLDAKVNELSNMTAEAYMIIEEETGIIYLGHEVDKPLGIASITKVMSIYLIYDYIQTNNISLSTNVVFGEHAASHSENPEASGRKNLLATDVISVGELLKLMIIESDNGATVALVEKFFKTEEQFVQKMNEQAKQFKMTNTKYVNATGLDRSDYFYELQTGTENSNISTAREQLLLAKQLLDKYPEIIDYTKLSTNIFDGEVKNNTNKMLVGGAYEYPGVVGLKTGASPTAGASFLGYYENQDQEKFLSIVLNAAGDRTIYTGTEAESRFIQTAKMYDYTNEVIMKTLIEKDQSGYELQFNGGRKRSYNLVAKKAITIPDESVSPQLEMIGFVPNEKYVEYEKDVKYRPYKIIADIPAGTEIGSIVLEDKKASFELIDGKKQEILVPVYAKEEILQENFFWMILNFFEQFFNNLFQ
ncbi:MAG: D-alanyl-D-alanine carboxypeptidase family protein [Mycoplasmatales bacterium]